MDTDITLDGSTATWVMPTMVGDLGGTYTGTFVFRTFLSPIRKLQAGREFREFLGQYAQLADEREFNLALALTQLKHRVIKAPPFWTSTLQDSEFAGNIGDLDVIGAVLTAAMRAEQMYKEKVDKEKDGLLEKTIAVAEKLLDKRRDG